jgi:hypothetical protein
MMKSKRQEALELEGELLRLNDLVRARRAQLARLERCPNKDCECRAVWRETVENNLARQVGKVRNHVRTGPRQASNSKPPGRKSAGGKSKTNFPSRSA